MSIKGDHKHCPQSTWNMARLFLHDLLPFHPIIPTMQQSWGHLKRGHTIFFYSIPFYPHTTFFNPYLLFYYSSDV